MKTVINFRTTPKKILSKAYYLVTMFLFFPTLALAQGSGKFENPLAFDDIQDLLAAILTAVMVISTPFVVFFLVYGGFKYVTAQGKPEQIKEATNSILYGVIGGVIIIASYTIIRIVKNLVESF